MYFDDETQERLRKLFLTLWDKAVGTETYNKKEWTELNHLIEKATRTSTRAPEEDPDLH